MTARLEQLLEDAGISLAEFIVLKFSCESPTACVTDVAQTLGHNAGATTRLVDRLEARGLLSRARTGADRRRVDIKPSKDGRLLIARLEPRLEAFWRQRFASFSAREQKELLAFVGRLADALQSHHSNYVSRERAGCLRRCFAADAGALFEASCKERTLSATNEVGTR